MQNSHEVYKLEYMSIVLVGNKDGQKVLVVKTHYTSNQDYYYEQHNSFDSIKKSNMSSLIELLKSNPNIQYIRIYGNSLITQVVKAVFEICKNIQTIDFEYPVISIEDITNLTAGLNKHPELSAISLHLNSVKNDVLQNLIPIAQCIKTLVLKCKIDNDVIQLLSQCNFLEKFVLEDTIIAQQFNGNMQKDTDTLASLLRNLCNLEYINLADNSFSDDDFKKLLEPLSLLKNLRTLIIDNNNLSLSSIVPLIQELSKQNSIITLSISFSDLKDMELMLDFALHIPLLTNLRSLCIKSCNMNFNSTQMLANALPNTGIQELDISNILYINTIIAKLAQTNIIKLITSHPLTPEVSKILEANKERLSFKAKVLELLMCHRRKKERNLPPEIWQLMYDEFHGLKVQEETNTTTDNHNPPPPTTVQKRMPINRNPTFFASHPRLEIAVYSTICAVLISIILWLQYKINFANAKNSPCFS